MTTLDDRLREAAASLGPSGATDPALQGRAATRLVAVA